MNRVLKIINGSNIIALGLIIFGSIILAENVPYSKIGIYAGYVSPFIGVFMFIVKYIQSIIKNGIKRIELIEERQLNIQQSIISINNNLTELNDDLYKNKTSTAINSAKLEVIGKYGQLEERLRESERKISALELFSMNQPE